MSQPSIETEFTTLGFLLRETRVQQKKDLATIADETKISYRNLQAMENDNFADLPAEAFSRGFYTLYAKVLSLNPEEILQKYSQEKAKLPRKDPDTAFPPTSHTNQVGDMAARPTIMPLSYIGLILFILLLFGAFISWYFSWNPATYLSEKLRSMQDHQQIEHVQEINQPPGHMESGIDTSHNKDYVHQS